MHRTEAALPTTKSRDDFLRRRAHHVAGHAVIAMADRVEVLGISLVPHEASLQSLDGLWLDPCVRLRLPDRGFENQKTRERMVRVALAGSVAESIHCDDDFNGTEFDISAHDWELASAIVSLFLEEPLERKRWLDTCLCRLAVLFKWPESHERVQDLAAKLLEQEVLEGKRVREVLTSPWEPEYFARRRPNRAREERRRRDEMAWNELGLDEFPANW